MLEPRRGAAFNDRDRGFLSHTVHNGLIQDSQGSTHRSVDVKSCSFSSTTLPRSLFVGYSLE